MGLFADIKAMNSVKRIKTGGRATLSISSITNLIINLANARNVLPNETFNEIYVLYTSMRKCKTKIEMDINDYYKTAADILSEFDKIYPCESYLGLEPFEASLLMDEIRKNSHPFPF